jgi:hypothetical protein
MLNAPIISQNAPYQKPERGEARGQPWPEPGLIRPSRAVTARLITAVGIGVAGIRHVPFPFWVSGVDPDKQMANGQERSPEHDSVVQALFTGWSGQDSGSGLDLR